MGLTVSGRNLRGILVLCRFVGCFYACVASCVASCWLSLLKQSLAVYTVAKCLSARLLMCLDGYRSDNSCVRTRVPVLARLKK